MRHHTAFVLSLVATCLLGIMAGFFYAFAIDVAPAMANLDASAYITTQQWINRVVRNATFGATYFGSALLPLAAALAAFWCSQRRVGLAWLAIGLVYFAGVFWLTRTVNVPINDALATWQAASPPSDWAHARDNWNDANLVRTWVAMACFVAAVVLVAVTQGRTR
ncbi:DUF1772 domain-containing protein [Rhodoferax sp. AJA081-3]|uniref:anthrone oxygenase family protein n=1 Tax=Rhodoferax sp. AJA081-3 TaxID=2752316 RepID=UPI001ADF571E|nr:anthrone oxygenase family protein [Rhodoferax sp. AJA081-3]QTN29433.1 DUF1772 domain-containing protein [Rhodoferax sp. AJA081-3]